MHRPRLKRTLARIETAKGNVFFLQGGTGGGVELGKVDDLDRRFLQALDGGHSRQDLEEEFGDEFVQEVLAKFAELGVVEDAADDDNIEDEVVARFDRQLRYFSDVSRGPTPSQCQKRLERARVAVLGVGGLGGWTSLALACCGIGEMLLVDFDRVELTNLNRQVVYGEDDIGRPKVEAAAERLASLNARMRVEVLSQRLEGESDIAAVIEGANVVIDAIDWPVHDIELWVNAACFTTGIPYIAMGHAPPVARVGPFYVPGKTGCYSCQEIAYRRSYELFDVAIEQLRAQPSPAAIIGPACALIGGQAALDVMHYLTGLVEPATLGVSHIYDLRTMELTREEVVPEPTCPVCHGALGETLLLP
ncbi:MAG: TOMM precursor leader peptide-binding protein [Solirubrobacterales bacterium]